MPMVRHLPVFVGPDGNYRRTGECNKCGDCCVGGDPWNGARGAPTIPGMCPALREGPDGTRICSVHGTDDPYWQNGCRVWPSSPDHVAQDHMGRCAFAFVRVE